MPGPIPIYSNLPINADYFAPSQFQIESIIKGTQTTVETSSDYNYVIGQLIRFLIPSGYGMQQLNNQTAYVIALLSDTEFLIDIDSTYYDDFNNPPDFPSYRENKTPPQVVAVGDVNTGQINTNGRQSNLTYINGSFQNISP